MTRHHTSTALIMTLTAVFVFALSLTALAAPYAPADVPPGPTYGSLPSGLVEDAGQPAALTPATAPQQQVAPDGPTVVLVASIVVGLFLTAGIGRRVGVASRRRRAVHA